MPSEEELIAIRVAVRQAQAANRELGKVARAIDEIGDEAAQTDRKADAAARSITRLGAASTSTRVNLGPFSTSMRGATLVVGGMVLAAEKLTPTVLSAGEAVATLAGGAGAAGGVGLLALGQASVVASLGLGDLTEALGGSEEAAQNLSLDAFLLYRQLTDAKDALQETAEAAMLPGLERGGRAAMRNFGVLRGVVRDTGRELGRLAGDTGEMLGSEAWGRDAQTLGRANVRIIGHLGDAGLHLADAARHIAVEAAPLAEWLAENAEQGAAAAESWAEGARAGGDLQRFFAEAKTDMRLFGESVDHVVDGLGNLFGNQDVSGTRLLEDIEQITARFEAWTNSPAVRRDFGQAIRDEVADGVAAAAGAAAETLPAAAGRAAEVFWESFWSADAEGKALIGILTGAKVAGGLRGMTPMSPLFVKEVGVGGRGPGGAPGGGRGGGRVPPWLPWIGRGGAYGAAAAGVGIGGYELAKVLGKWFGEGKTPEEYLREDRAQAQRNGVRLDAQGFRERGTRAIPDPGDAPASFNHPGIFEPTIRTEVTLKVGEEKLAKAQVRGRAKVDARRR